MAVYNENIELFKCYVRASHLTKNDADKDTYHKAYAFAVQSIAGKILTFHVMTDYGMLRSRVPISDIFMEIPKNDIPFHFKQLWDCFSENVTVTTYDYLYENDQLNVLYNILDLFAKNFFGLFLAYIIYTGKYFLAFGSPA